MKNRLDRLATQVFNRPHLIDGGKLDVIMAAVGSRILTGAEVAVPKGLFFDDDFEERPYDGPGTELETGGYVLDSGVGVFPISGTLVRRGSYLGDCGLTSYDAIGEGADAMLADGRVKGILLEIDSPGGEASGCFDLVRQIRAMAVKSKKPVWAIANDMACSGGYAIACAADQIWITELGEAGSIGVVATHVDVSAADKKNGYKWNFIKRGDRKIDGNPHEPLSSEARASLQDDIDTIYDKFVSVVADARGITAEAVKETEAAIFMGLKAVEVGLADSVGTLDEALSAFAKHLNGKRPAGGLAQLNQNRSANMALKSKPGASNKAAARTKKAEAEEAEVAAAAAEAGEGEGEEEEEEIEEEETLVVASPKKKPAVTAPAAVDVDRAMAIGELAAYAKSVGVQFDSKKAMASKLSIDAMRRQIQDAQADADEETDVVATAPTASARDANTKAEIDGIWNTALKRAHEARGLKYNG